MPERFVRNGEIWKACSRCGEEKPHNDEHYYRDGKRKGEVRYTSDCRLCRREKDKQGRTDRSPRAQARQRRRLRARQRAWVRLAQEWPERFQELYAEELFREGPVP